MTLHTYTTMYAYQHAVTVLMRAMSSVWHFATHQLLNQLLHKHMRNKALYTNGVSLCMCALFSSATIFSECIYIFNGCESISIWHILNCFQCHQRIFMWKLLPGTLKSNLTVSMRCVSRDRPWRYTNEQTNTHLISMYRCKILDENSVFIEHSLNYVSHWRIPKNY